MYGSTASTQGMSDYKEVLEFEEGRVVEQKTYQPADLLSGQTVFTYDSAGHLVETVHRDASGRVNWKYEYVYDEQGRLTREVTYGASGLVDQVVVHEYRASRLSETVRYGRSGDIEWRRIYQYDNETVSWEVLTAEGLRVKNVEQEYDFRGRLIREQHRDQYETVFDDIQFRFAERQKPERVTRYDGSGTVQQEDTYQYDQRGNVVYHETSRPDDDQSRRVTSVYRYDRWNNWVERTDRYYTVTEDEAILTREKRIHRDLQYQPSGEESSE
jgi:antitoxin component YwqK of YwqJK toxin-antitoxin module